jgi:molybdate transport system permease protein
MPSAASSSPPKRAPITDAPALVAQLEGDAWQGVALDRLSQDPGFADAVAKELARLPPEDQQTLVLAPPVSTGLILLKIFGRRSPLGQWLYQMGFEIVFNWKGVLIAMAVMSFPLLVRSVRISFAEVNPRLEQIAATLGASPLRIFFVITIPLAYKGIVAGALLAFSRALGEFGATILLAGNIPGRTQTLSLAIYNFVQLGKDPEAYVLLGITVVLAFLFVWISEWLLRTEKKV